MNLTDKILNIAIKIANGMKDVDNLRDNGGKENQKTQVCELKPPRTDLLDRTKPKNISKDEMKRDYGDTHNDPDLKL